MPHLVYLSPSRISKSSVVLLTCRVAEAVSLSITSATMNGHFLRRQREPPPTAMGALRWNPQSATRDALQQNRTTDRTEVRHEYVKMDQSQCGVIVERIR